MRVLLAILLLAVSAGSAHPAVFTNNVSVDAFVRASAPTLNFGGAGALSVSGPGSVNGSGVTNGVFDSFIRFNTAAMVTNFNSIFGPNNWVINGVKLRVTELGAPSNALFNRGRGAFEIRWIANDNWIEGMGMPNAPATTGLTYNDKAALLNGGAGISLGTFTNAGMDITLSFPLALPEVFIGDVKAGGEVGLFLTAVDSGIGFTVDSRSFGTVAARPFLEISAVPAPGAISIHVVGTDVVLLGRNGAMGETYVALSSTNVSFPVNTWSPIATNVLSANGDFAITITNAASARTSLQKFFVIQKQ